MRYRFGVLLQLLTLVVLPLMILWQLNFGFNLIFMPVALLVGIVVFTVGTRLRES